MGPQPISFKKTWRTVQVDVNRVVQEFFDKTTILSVANPVVIT